MKLSGPNNGQGAQNEHEYPECFLTELDKNFKKCFVGIGYQNISLHPFIGGKTLKRNCNFIIRLFLNTGVHCRNSCFSCDTVCSFFD